MAGKVKGITIELQADTKSWDKAIRKAEYGAKGLDKELREVNNALKFNPKNTELLAQKQRLLKQRVDTTKKALKELRTAQAQMDAKGVNENSEQYMKLRRSIIQTESKLKHFEAQEKDVNSEGRKISKVNDGYTTLKATIANLASTAIVEAIRGMERLASAAKQAWEEFDAGEDAVIKATGATGAAADELRENYENVAKSVKGDFETLGSTLGEVQTRMGFEGKELEDATIQFQKFSEITGVDATEAVRLVSRAMGDAGIETEDYAKILDQLAAAAQASGIEVSTLTEYLTKYGAPMRALGFDTEEAIALFAAWEKSGVNVEIAMSGMKKAISNWSKEGKDARVEFKKTLDEIKATPDIASATAKAIEIFGTKAGPDLADAIKNGRFEYEDFLKVLEGSDGAVSATYDETIDGMDKLKLSFQRVRVDLAKWFGEFMDKYGPAIEKALEKGVKALKGFFDFFAKNAKIILPLIGAITTAMAGIWAKNKISGFIDKFKVLINLMKSMPLLGIAAGVGAVVAGFLAWDKATHEEYYALQELKKANDEVLESRKSDAASALIEEGRALELKDKYNQLVDSKGQIIKGHEKEAEVIKTQLAEALGIEKSDIDELIDKNGKYSEELDKLIAKKQAEAWISEHADEVVEAQDRKNEATQSLIEGQTKLNELSDEQREKLDSIMELYKTDPGEAYMQAKINGLTEYVDAAEQVDDANTAISDSQKIIDQNNLMIAASSEGTADAVNAALAQMLNDYGNFEDMSREELEQVVADLEAQTTTVYEMSKSNKSLEPYVEQYRSLRNQAKQALNKMPADAKSAATKTSQNLKIDTSSTGADYVQGLINGIDTKSGDLYVAAQTVAQSALDVIKKVLGIKSPSKETAKVGRFFGEGFALGILDEVAEVAKASEVLSGAALNGLEKPRVLGGAMSVINGGHNGVTVNGGQLDGLADSIVSGMGTIQAAASGGGMPQQIVIQTYLYPSGPKMGEQIVKTYDTYKNRVG